MQLARSRVAPATRIVLTPLAIGFIVTLVLAAIVVAALLRTGGAKAVSDNAAIIGALIALGGVGTTQLVSAVLVKQNVREEALHKYYDRMGNLFSGLRDQAKEYRNQNEQSMLFDANIEELSSKLERAREDFAESLPELRDRQEHPEKYPVGSGLSAFGARKLEKQKREAIEDLERQIDTLRLWKESLDQDAYDTLALMRAQTLAVLDQVGNRRKRLIMRFLSEAAVIKYREGSKGRGVELSGADFSGADLTHLDLSYCNLKGTNFRGADLSGSDLTGADLSGADLSRTKVTDEQLRTAIRSEEAPHPTPQSAPHL